MPEPTIDDVKIDPATGMPELPPGQFWRVRKGTGKFVTVQIMRESEQITGVRLGTFATADRELGYENVHYETNLTYGDYVLEWTWRPLLGFLSYPRRVKVPLYIRTTYASVSGVTNVALGSPDETTKAVLAAAVQIRYSQLLLSYKSQTDQDSFNAVVGDYPPKKLT